MGGLEGIGEGGRGWEERRKGREECEEEEHEEKEKQLWYLSIAHI